MTKNQDSLNKNEIGKRIKGLRTSRGMTLEQFGELFNPPASKSIVSRWEAGKSIPSNERLKVISHHFYVSTMYLLYGERTLTDVFSIGDGKTNIATDALDDLENDLSSMEFTQNKELIQNWISHENVIQSLGPGDAELIARTLFFLSNVYKTKYPNKEEIVNKFSTLLEDATMTISSYEKKGEETPVFWKNSLQEVKELLEKISREEFKKNNNSKQ